MRRLWMLGLGFQEDKEPIANLDWKLIICQSKFLKIKIWIK